MGRGGTALGIIGIILAAGAIGFTYVVWNGQNSTNNLTRTSIVGIWDTLNENQDFAPYNLQRDWLLEFGDNSLNNTDFISVSNTNTRITLLKSGWYRIHLSVILDGISPGQSYRMRILKDGALDFVLDYYQAQISTASIYYSIDSSAFVYSDGTNYIEINGRSSTDDFSVPSFDLNNQLTIQFVTT